MAAQTAGISGAIAAAHRDRAVRAARMLTILTGDIYSVVSFGGQEGLFYTATDDALRQKQEHGGIGAYVTHFTSKPADADIEAPTFEKIEYRLGRKVYVLSSGALIYDDREATGEYVVSEGVLTALPLAEALAHLFGGVVRVKTFSQAIQVATLFAYGFVKNDYRWLVERGLFRAN